MPRSVPSSFSSSFSDGASNPDTSPCRRKVSTRSRRPPCRGCKIVAKYPHGLPDPSDELEVRYASLDTAKITARALVAADDLIVRIFDVPRLRLHVSSISRATPEHTSRSDYSHFKRSFRSAFGKNVDLERTAETFTQRMQDQGLVEKDEDSALAFSKYVSVDHVRGGFTPLTNYYQCLVSLCIRYAQLTYHTSRVTISQVVLNEKIQSRILATSDISKGTLILELGGLMSSDAIMSGSLVQDSKKRKREEAPQYNMLSVIRKGPRQCGPGAPSDRLLLGPARFVNHSCEPNCKVRA